MGGYDANEPADDTMGLMSYHHGSKARFSPRWYDGKVKRYPDGSDVATRGAGKGIGNQLKPFLASQG